MKWSISIGAVKGTVIRLHVTFLLFLLWIAIMSYMQAGAAAAFGAIAFFTLLFLCVALHEFGHVLTARRFGVLTPDVTLLPIGGIARIDRIPEKPVQELLIALAGPLVNFGIAGLLVLLIGALPDPVAMMRQDKPPGLLELLALANLSLGLFNLIPAFPMDGGRALRALLSVRMGYVRATRVAAVTGQIFAVLFGVAGLMMGHFILVLIAIFIYLAAGTEAGIAQLRRSILGRSAADIMITSFEPLAADMPLGTAAQALIRTAQHEFPVTDQNGRLQGLLTRTRLLDALQRGNEQTLVGDVMQADLPSVLPTASAREAMQMLEHGAPAIEVATEQGEIRGFITWDNLLEFLLISEAAGRRHRALGLSGTSLPVLMPRTRRTER